MLKDVDDNTNRHSNGMLVTKLECNEESSEKMLIAHINNNAVVWFDSYFNKKREAKKLIQFLKKSFGW